MEFNDFTLDLLVEPELLEDTPVFRPPATCGPTSSSGDSAKNTEFFFSFGMSCPIDGCPPTLTFSTKAKYQRHWMEKHLPEVISYACPVVNCKVACRRRYDMKVHLLRVHGTNKGLVESILSKGHKTSRPNASFIDPGSFSFYGRTSPPVAKDAAPPVPLTSASVSVASSSSPVVPDEVPIPNSEVLEPPAKKTLTVQEYLTKERTVYSTSRPLHVSTQTRCQDFPPFSLPDVPETQEEILAYVHWIETLSHSLNLKKKAAEERLACLKATSSEILVEREKRRKLEVENLRLRGKLADLKAVNLLFPEL